MLIEPRPPCRLHQISGLESRLPRARASAVHEPEMAAMLTGHQFYDDARFRHAGEPRARSLHRSIASLNILPRNAWTAHRKFLMSRVPNETKPSTGTNRRSADCRCSYSSRHNGQMRNSYLLFASTALPLILFAPYVTAQPSGRPDIVPSMVVAQAPPGAGPGDNDAPGPDGQRNVGITSNGPARRANTVPEGTTRTATSSRRPASASGSARRSSPAAPGNPATAPTAPRGPRDGTRFPRRKT